MSYIISVSKTYKHRGKNIKHRDNTKKVWQVMGYVKNFDGNLVLFSSYVNPITALFCKLMKFKQTKYICPNCYEESLNLYRWFKNPKCANCDV